VGRQIHFRKGEGFSVENTIMFRLYEGEYGPIRAHFKCAASIVSMAGLFSIIAYDVFSLR